MKIICLWRMGKSSQYQPLHHQVILLAVSQTEIEKRIIKDFKFSLRDKKLSRTIKIMMNISIILFVILAVLQTVTLNIEVKKYKQLEDTLNLVNMIFSRYTSVVGVVVQMRVANNIMSNTESSITPMTTDRDRLIRYLTLLNEATSNLKELETTLPDNPQWQFIKDKSERKELSIVDFTYDLEGNIYSYATNMTMQNAMQAFIIKSSYMEEYKKNMTAHELQEYMKKLTLYFKFVYTNGLATLLDRMQSISNSLFEEVMSSYSAEKLYLEILNVCIGIIGIISLCTLIPILRKINTSIRKILLYFAQFSKEDHNKVLERIAKFRSIIGQHFREVKKYFSTINFQEDIYKRDQTAKDASILVSSEQNRKLNGLVKQSKVRTNSLMLQFAIFALGFCGLLAFSIYNTETFFIKLDFSLKIFQYAAYRPPYTSVLLAILRQEIDTGEILKYDNITDLYQLYRENFATNEAKLMYSIHLIKKYYPTLYENWMELDSNKGCSLVFNNNTIRTTESTYLISVPNCIQLFNERWVF